MSITAPCRQNVMPLASKSFALYWKLSTRLETASSAIKCRTCACSVSGSLPWLTNTRDDPALNEGKCVPSLPCYMRKEPPVQLQNQILCGAVRWLLKFEVLTHFMHF